MAAESKATSGKFATYAPIGFSASAAGYAILAQKQNISGRVLIVAGIVAPGNNLQYDCTESSTVPRELVYVLRPSQKVYRVSADLSWTEFTERNTNLGQHLTIANPCCCVEKITGLAFFLSSFDPISQAMISSGQIHNKVVGLYLSATEYGHASPMRQGVIIFPDSPVLKGDLKSMRIVLGIPSFVAGSHSTNPKFNFNIISGAEFWEQAASYR